MNKKIKITIHTIRYQGEATTTTKNFGKKFVVFTIKKDEIKDQDILNQLSSYVPGMRNKHLISVNGYLEEHIEEGVRCEIEFPVSSISYEDKYRMYSIKVDSISKLLEITPAGFLRYMGLKYKGVGPKLSEKIFNYISNKYGVENSKNFLEYFNEELLLEENKDLKKVMGPKKYENTKQQHVQKEEELEDNQIRLNDDEIQFSVNNDIAPNFILRLKKQIIRLSTNQQKNDYKEHSVVPYLMKTPYLIAIDQQIKGFQFKSIDSKVYKFIDKNQWESQGFKEQRIYGFLKYILIKKQESGHLFLNDDEVYNEFVIYNEDDKDGKQFDIEENAEFFFEYIVELIEALDNAINPFLIYDGKLFLKDNFRTELNVAKRLDFIKNNFSIEEYEEEVLSKELSELEEQEGIALSEEQREAVLNTINSKISIITGGPGTGKTTISNMVIKLLQKKGKSIKILAPTGTAAKRVSVVSGMEATTIHRGLGFKGKFEFNFENPLTEDVIICDESSMIDVFLGLSLIEGSRKSQLVFIGDVNQLPSVGAGDFLRDVINSNQFQVSKLTKIFRQAGDNPIVQFAYKVNDGANIPDFFQWYSKKDTLEPKLMILVKDEFKKMVNGKENPDYLNNIISAGTEYGMKTYLTKTNTLFDAQILVSNNRSNNKINIELQEALNPDGKPVPNIVKGKDTPIFRVGDKIIQTKNNYKLNVFNGSIGVLKSYNPSTDLVTIEYMSDKESKEIPVDVLNKQNKLCYSMTIHKSQGQEFPRVIMLVNDFLLNSRELIYTGATRAKNNLIIITNTLLLSMGINNSNKKEGNVVGSSARNTKLIEFLQMTMEEKDKLQKTHLTIEKREEKKEGNDKEVIESIVFD